MKRKAFLTILSVIAICLIGLTTESCKTTGNSSEKNHISFSYLSTTKMFCDNMTDETAFLQALRSTRYYSVAGDTLILKDENRTSLAKLSNVHVK